MSVKRVVASDCDDVTDLQLKKSGTASKEVLTVRDEEKPKVGKNGRTGGHDAHAINTDHPTS